MVDLWLWSFPVAPAQPLYTRETHTSQRKRRDGEEAGPESPLPTSGDGSEDDDYDSESDLESLNSLPRVIDSVSDIKGGGGEVFLGIGIRRVTGGQRKSLDNWG